MDDSCSVSMANRLRLEYRKGCIVVMGNDVDEPPEYDTSFIPERFIQNRIKRDGTHSHHVTLILAREIKAMAKGTKSDGKRKGNGSVAKDIINAAYKKFGKVSQWPPFKDLGLGMARGTDNCSCYFRVLEWPFCMQLRKSLGLGPMDFHITIGFDPSDVHGCSKGPSSLLPPRSVSGMEEELWDDKLCPESESQ